MHDLRFLANSIPEDMTHASKAFAAAAHAAQEAEKYRQVNTFISHSHAEEEEGMARWYATIGLALLINGPTRKG